MLSGSIGASYRTRFVCGNAIELVGELIPRRFDDGNICELELNELRISLLLVLQY